MAGIYKVLKNAEVLRDAVEEVDCLKILHDWLYINGKERDTISFIKEL